MKIHIVQKGDTLWKIAKKYGVNFEELKQMNNQLSNPDMIMPGMKIKVPTTGGTIKKEAPLGTQAKINYGTKKEMPIAQQPLIKEQPKTLPIKEAPIQMPIKEAPIMPIKEAPVKEVPIAPYIPQMPQAVIPEIDINNYYMMNMANLSVQQPPAPQLQPQLPPKPVNILPEVKEEPIQESIPEPVEQPIQGGFEQPMLPYPQYCYPISPVLPGSGLHCPPMPCPPVPCPPGYPYMPYQQVQGMTSPYQNGGYRLEGQGFMPVLDDESEPFMPQMPVQMPAQMPAQMPVQMPTYTAPVAEPQMPACPPYPQAAPMMHMPYGHMPYCGPLYPVSPVLPGSGLPYGQFPTGYPQAGGFPQVQGAMDVESPEMMNPAYQTPYPMPQAMPMQQMAPPPVAGTNDCGCGGPKPYYGAPMPQGVPYPQGAPMPQGVPYPQGAQMPQGVPYPQGAQMPQGVPYPQGAPMPQGAPYPQNGQGMSLPYGQQGQSPLMNPYGPGPMDRAYSMPKYQDESSEYEG